MIVIVDHAMPKDEEESKEAVVKTVKVIEKDVEELLRFGLQMVI